MSQEANTTIPLPLLNTDTIVQNEIDTIENELVTLKNERKSKKETITDTSKNCFSCKERSPKQVAFYAAMCPGLGQIYNKKYWKLPIVYAGIGTGVFFISYCCVLGCDDFAPIASLGIDSFVCSVSSSRISSRSITAAVNCCMKSLVINFPSISS